MTFKDTIIWSRVLAYRVIASCYIESVKDDNYVDAHCYCSMMWLKHFNESEGYHKIRYWRYALKAYKFYKIYKQKHPDESLKIKTKHLP